MTIEAEDIEVVDSYLEDGEINVLVGMNQRCPLDLRWVITIDPSTGKLKEVTRCKATDEGFEYY